ncbi:hypothetical protein CCACVL1_19471 [Corchorus capsularis]|uniref:Uncharacterized protein n=1 Tax=Corchorus capsularis TaxID=210143 RepID=A0A1R3HGJ8_COCAP|nr:hypothetical protein CCACVL1_19471 [Corchorus capsularis]
MSIFRQQSFAPKGTHPQLTEEEEEEEYGEIQSLQVNIRSKNNQDDEFSEGHSQLMQTTSDNKSHQQQLSPKGALLQQGYPIKDNDSKEPYQSSSHSQQKQTPIKSSQGYTSEDDTLRKISTSKELSLKDEYLPNATKAKHFPQQQLSSRAKGNPQEHVSHDTLHLLPSGRVHSSPKDNSPQRCYDSPEPSKSQTSPASASPKINQHSNQSFYPKQQPSPVTPHSASPPPQRFLSRDDSTASSQDYSSKSKTAPVSASPKINQHGNQSFYTNQQPSPVIPPSATPPPQRYLSGNDSTASSQNYSSKSKTSPVSASPKNNQHGNQSFYPNQQQSPVTPSASPPPETFLSGDDSTASSQNYASKSKTSPVSAPPKNNHSQQKFLSGDDYIASSQNSECNQTNDYDTHRSELPSVKDSTAQRYRAPSKPKEHENGSQKSVRLKLPLHLAFSRRPKIQHYQELIMKNHHVGTVFPVVVVTAVPVPSYETRDYLDRSVTRYSAPKDAHRRRLWEKEEEEEEEYGENHSLQMHMGSENDQDDEFGEEQSQLMQMRSDNKSWQQQLSPKGALLQQGYPLNDSDSKEPYQSSNHSQQKQTPVASSQGYTPQVDTPLKISTSKEFSLKGDYLPNATKTNHSPQQQLLSGAKGKHPRDNTFDPQHLLPSGDDSTSSSQNYPSKSKTYPVSAPPKNDHPQHSNQTPYPNQQPSPVTPPPASIPQRFLPGDDSTTSSQNSRRNQTIYYGTHTSKSPSVKDPYEQGHRAPSKSEEHENANHNNVATMKEEGLTGNAATTIVESSPKNISLPRVHSKEPASCPCSNQ